MQFIGSNFQFAESRARELVQDEFRIIADLWDKESKDFKALKEVSSFSLQPDEYNGFKIAMESCAHKLLIYIDPLKSDQSWGYLYLISTI